ncbi:MAG TPA: endolytic transglycosylase MltG [Acidimicrobiia bacterium]|jgi:UPF0755 protein
MTLTPSTTRVPRWLRVLAAVAVTAIVVVVGATTLGRMVADRVGSGGGGTNVTVLPGQEVDVSIPPGSSAQEIAAILAAQGVVSSSTEFELAVRASGTASQLKAGTYTLLTGMQPGEVVTLLVRGPVAETYRITVREGLRVSEMLDVLSEASGIPVAELEDALTNGTVTTSLRQMPATPAVADWEGLLFPDTYEFLRTATATQILQRLAETMESRVAAIDWARFQQAGFNKYQGIVIASMIESEVRVPSERPLVSSVIRNRLDQEMPLQIDATVLYALGTRDIAEFDSDFDSPFNTYKVAGLPPAPISAPGRASLEAAASPAASDYLFYVLSAADGSHTFTTNYADHQQAVAQAKADGIIP